MVPFLVKRFHEFYGRIRSRDLIYIRRICQYVDICKHITNISVKIPFLFLSQIFAGNTDRNTVITHSLKPHIEARYVRFHPLTHNHNIPCLRAEVYGCRNGKLFICYSSHVKCSVT